MRVSVYYAGGGSPISAGPPTCSAARGPQKVLLQKEIRRVMIHSFRKHGASLTAPARAPLTPRCIRMAPGPPANAPPPYARLILWLLLAVPPTPPGSQAETPARFGKEPVGPTRSAAGRR